jgi:hypothetical protein
LLSLSAEAASCLAGSVLLYRRGFDRKGSDVKSRRTRRLFGSRAVDILYGDRGAAGKQEGEKRKKPEE